MKLPANTTEDEVLEAMEIVAKGLAYKYKFGPHTLEDMRQFAKQFALEGLCRYDSSKGKLTTFLWTHVKNQLFNLKRNKFERPDKPCFNCPLSAYDPNCHYSYNQCTAYEDKDECVPYKNWYNRNERKRNIVSPIGIGNVKDEQERNMRINYDVGESIDNASLIATLDKNIPISLRKSWIKMKTDIKMPKAERTKLLDAIRLILVEENIDES